MERKIKKFLKDNDFLPLSRWNNFKIIHRHITPKSQEKKNDFNIIKNHVSKKNGLYIYEKNRKIIYVGKGKPLSNRIKNHYISAYQEVLGDTKDKIWHNFFSSEENLGELRIYWRELQKEKDRQIIEKILHYILNPTFNLFYKKMKKESKLKYSKMFLEK